MSFLGPLESFIGMFQGLLGMLVPGLVIFFPVVCGGCTVRVRGEFVEFGSSLVRVIWHSVPVPDFRSTVEPFHFLNCPIGDTRPDPPPTVFHLVRKTWPMGRGPGYGARSDGQKQEPEG